MTHAAKNESRYAGVHLSGPNAGKTAVVVLRRAGAERPLQLQQVYEKIGALGTLFSDERLVEILVHGGPFAEVFVDCPLTVPPCVSCQRPVCPGVIACEDLTVATMLGISTRVRRKGARRGRPVNPQSQRLWDVLQLVEPADERLEPSYSANLAPLVVRARTLQRRLNALPGALELRETSVTNALELARATLGLPPGIRLAYRNFEHGTDTRQRILDRMVELGWLGAPPDSGPELDAHAACVETVEAFHALITAWVAALHAEGLTRSRPDGYVEGEGWVWLPHLHDSHALTMPVFE